MTDYALGPGGRPSHVQEQNAALANHGRYRRLLAGLVICVLLGQLAFAWRAVEHAERVLAPEIAGKADAVAADLADRIERALALGIPIDRLVGMTPMLDDTVVRDQSIVFLGVLAPDGFPLYLAGRRILPQNLPIPSKLSDPNARFSFSNDGHALRLRPLHTAGRHAGYLVVGIPTSVAMDHLADVITTVPTIAIVAAIASVQVLLFVLLSGIRLPLARIQRAFTAVANGDFRWLIPISVGGDIGQLASAANRAVRHVNERYREVMLDAEETRHSRIDHDAPARVEAVLAPVRAEVTAAQPGGESVTQVRSASLIRLPLFLVMVAETAMLPVVPGVLAALAGTDVVAAPAALWLAVLISAILLAFVAGIPLAQYLCARGRSAAALWLGAGSAATGHIGTWLVGDPLLFMLARLLATTGTGLMAAAANTLIVHQDGSGARETSDGTHGGLGGATDTILAGLVCGPAIGGLVAGTLAATMLFPVAAGLALLSIGLLWTVRRHITDDSSGTIQDHHLATHHAPWPTGSPWSAATILAVQAAVFGVTAATLVLFAPIALAGRDDGGLAAGQTVMAFALTLLLLRQPRQRLRVRASGATWPLGLSLLGTVAAIMAIGIAPMWPGLLVAATLLGISLAAALALSPGSFPAPTSTPRMAERVTLSEWGRLLGVLGPIMFTALMPIASGPALALTATGAGLAVMGGALARVWPVGVPRAGIDSRHRRPPSP